MNYRAIATILIALGTTFAGLPSAKASLGVFVLPGYDTEQCGQLVQYLISSQGSQAQVFRTRMPNYLYVESANGYGQLELSTLIRSVRCVNAVTVIGNGGGVG